jgi:hypothetical protein
VHVLTDDVPRHVITPRRRRHQQPRPASAAVPAISPPGATFEREQWGVTLLRLVIKPDKGGKPCRASLTSLTSR